MSETKKTGDTYSAKPFIILGYLTIILAFGVLGGWAMTAPLDSAVIAPGTLSVESSKKIVQHYEGGIVKEILVKDSQKVEAGQVLVRLNEIQSLANDSMVQTRLEVALAESARLVAERTNETDLIFPERLLESSDLRIKRAIQTQRNLFTDRVSVRDSQIKILGSKTEQFRQQIGGLELQRDAAKKEIDLIEDEVRRLKEGQGKGVVSTNRLSSLQREEAQLSGAFGRLISDIARVKEGIDENALEVVRIKQSFSERAATELKEVRQELGELEERTAVTADVLERTEIRAEVDGIVQNMQIHTVGGVIKPGEPIMEIVPIGDEIVINAHIRTLDIDNLYPGLVAEVRLSAFTSRYIPSIFGNVEYLSPDTIQPKNPNEPPYYLARIVVAEVDIPEEIKGKLTPGMPADVIIPTGERTVAQYLIQPLENAVSKSWREE